MKEKEMFWKKMVASTTELSAAKAKSFMAEKAIGSYQLIDVRQPKEYQQHHLPGAHLIPLAELANRLDEIKKGQPLIVYCRSGVRSKAACQQLENEGFDQVYNLTGGILAWQGQTASGRPEQGLDFFLKGDYASGALMAYTMEAGLKSFYLALAESLDDQQVAKTCRKMARFEDGHLAGLAKEISRQGLPLPTPAENPLVEGGYNAKELQQAFCDHLDSSLTVLHLAMTLEAQAFDLYLRLARKTEDEKTKTFYLDMARQEQQHLAQLSSELNAILQMPKEQTLKTD